jgi:hypothetical protein
MARNSKIGMEWLSLQMRSRALLRSESYPPNASKTELILARLEVGWFVPYGIASYRIVVSRRLREMERRTETKTKAEMQPRGGNQES